MYWKLIIDGHAVDGKLYSKQLDRVYEVLRTRYPELINRKRFLLQHNNINLFEKIIILCFKS